jgi:hypothetical protein
MVDTLYLYSPKQEAWNYELEFRWKLEICKLQISSSPNFTIILLISLEEWENQQA